MTTVTEILNLARSWLGRRESDGSHKYIIDIYNKHKPLARGYKVKYTDEWCATTISALAIQCGATDIIPTECGCGEMIKLCQQNGIWVENENRVPNPGDIIFYDWQDSGKGDNTGWADHVGIVEKVNGSTITVIEGNKGEAVARRQIEVNAKGIRGYATPKHEKEAEIFAPVVQKHVVANEDAMSFDKSLAGTYKSTTSLNVRYGAGATKKKMVTIPGGTKVKNYGYYTRVLGTNWLYIQFTLNGTKYTGFASGKYLMK